MKQNEPFYDIEEKKELFHEITKHLMTDTIPSEFMNRISNESIFLTYPYQMLLLQKKTEQSRKHHPEGNVWNHTMLVIDEAARIREESTDSEVFMWASLLHDIGKPGTTRMRKGRITSYDHDITGAKLCKEFLSYLEADEDFIQKVSILVKYHMHMLYILNGLPYGDRNGLIREADIHELALISFCDRLGRKGADRIKEEKEYRLYQDKLWLMQKKIYEPHV